MPYWYEVFDNEHVQFLTRRRVAGLMAAGLAGVGVTLALFVVGHLAGFPPAAVYGPAAALWPAAAWRLMKRWKRLRRVVWCIKISDHHIVGYDYARRQTAIDWVDVGSVDLNNTGVVISGTDGFSIEAPHLYPDFAALSHRIIQYAEIYGAPVSLDGVRLNELDLNVLFPFLPALTSDSDQPS